MAFDTLEEGVKTGQKFIAREGWLGWVIVAATILLGFYVWDSHRQSERLVELLRVSQELQQDSLIDRREKTEAIRELVEANQALAERSKIAAENLQQLVSLVTVGYQIDEQRTTSIIKKLEKVANASKMSAEEIKQLRDLFANNDGS